MRSASLTHLRQRTGATQQRKEESERVAKAAAAAEARALEKSELELKQLQEKLAAQRENARQAQQTKL